MVIAGILAFVLYAVLGGLLIEPYDKEFEVTLVTTFFQGAVYLIMMLLANAFYSSGYFVDKWFNATNEEPFRVWLFNFGYWFSILLPFTIPLIIVIQYFTVYRK